MSHDSNQSSNAAGTWTEPPWSGWIETTGDALLILEAARRGLIPRVTRRLVDSERKMITSGSVFVFDEDESGIKRWTDGFFWSPSRILGNFLLYRETEKRGAGHRTARVEPPQPEVSEAQYNVDGVKLEGQTLSRPKGESNRLGIDRQRERILVGSLTNSYKFKPGGMMKKTFSLTIGGVAQHLISYYKVEDVEQGRLRSPSTLPELASLDISPEYLDKTHFRNPPKVEIGIDGVPRYRGEADDADASPHLVSAPLSSGLTMYEEPREAKRSRRYDPYNPSPAPSTKRRKGKGTSADGHDQSHVSMHQPQPEYASEPTMAAGPAGAVIPHYAPYSYYQVPPPPGYPVYPSTPYPHVPTPPHHTPTPPQAAAQTSSAGPAPPPGPAVAYAGYPGPGADGTQYPYYPPHGYAAYPGWGYHPGGYAPPPLHQPAATAPTASNAEGDGVGDTDGDT